ncbi:MAG: hypothetical protein QGF09_07425, partial [Rhodospirillales bacterium]|nr:hypothetical protein [Rhodospirillales bacterium]
KKLDAAATQVKINRVLTDFKRDSGTKEISYFGQGAFKVKWVKSGDVLRSRMVTFFRRNENMASISFSKIKKRSPSAPNMSNAATRSGSLKFGLGMQGGLRIKTSARVLEHNACKVTEQGPVTTYAWKIKDIFQQAPKLLIAFP